MRTSRQALTAIALWAVTTTLALGAEPGSVPGDSAASVAEQADIAVALMQHYRTEHDCLTAQVTFATSVATDPGGTNAERWTVSHCGALSTHFLTYEPGATDSVGSIAIDEGRSEVVLPEASVSCTLDERKSQAKRLEAEADGAPTDAKRVELRIYALMLRSACYPRPLKSLQDVGAALVTVAFSREGKLLEHRLERSSGDALMDAEARFVWTRIAALKRKLKVPKGFAQGDARLEFRLPVGFRAH